jgi:hypothetical protein
MTTETKATIELSRYIGKSQLSVMMSACKGEEGPFFRQMMADLRQKIATMPKTYETDGQGDEAIAHLHYFKNASDWYIMERDQEEEQLQAHGFAILNQDYQNAESGYISIEELIRHGIELDLYYTPEKLGAIKARLL